MCVCVNVGKAKERRKREGEKRKEETTEGHTGPESRKETEWRAQGTQSEGMEGVRREEQLLKSTLLKRS